MNIKVSAKGTGKNKVMVIELPMQPPTLSASGKSLVVATTRGNVRTDFEVDGKFITLGLNAFISNK